MNLKKALLEYIPPAYYSDGRIATCMTFRIFNMFVIDSYSFKQVKEKKVMESGSKKSDYKFLDRFLAEKEKRELE